MVQLHISSIKPDIEPGDMSKEYPLPRLVLRLPYPPDQQDWRRNNNLDTAAFLDRVNIGNALTLGLPHDLHLKGNESNVALTIFFVPYVLFEVPSNILMKRFKPHVWLSGCILAFGIVMLCQGFVQSYRGLLATRFFLGLAEAGVFPGCKLPFYHRYWTTRPYYGLAWPSLLVCCHKTIFSFLISTLTIENRFLRDQLLVQTRRIPATLHSILVLRYSSHHVWGSLSQCYRQYAWYTRL